MDQCRISGFPAQGALQTQGLAGAFDRLLEESLEKGVPPCPECFAVDAAPDGFMKFRRLPSVKVQLIKCRACRRRFRRDWLPVKSHGLAEQTCLVLTMVECGVGVSGISEALCSLSRELRWVVPLSKQSILHIIQSASEALRGLERRLFSGSECGKVVAIAVKRKRAGGKFYVALAVEDSSACWLEAKPFFDGSMRAFAEELAYKVKPIEVAASPLLAEAIRHVFPDSSIQVLESELINKESSAIVPVVKRVKRVVKKNVSYFSEQSVDAMLTVARAHYNFFGKLPPAKSMGIPLPRLLRGWMDLLRYAAYVQKFGK